MAAEHHEGGCHCGAVRFAVDVDTSNVIACNCSICAKQGLWLSFADASAFELRSGEDQLLDYRFASGKISHLRCAACGVESFARGQKPDGTAVVAVNVRCLDGININSLSPKPVNGRAL